MKAGGVAIFEVPFKAYPVPDINWKHNGASLPKQKRIQQETVIGITSLRLRECELADAGEYTLTIANDHGELSTTYTLTVLDKPQPPQNLAARDVTEESCVLTWEPPTDDGGSPVKGYIVEKREASRRSWQKVETTRDTKVKVNDLMEGQGYYFQVRAENEHGLSEPVQISQAITPASQYSK